MSKYKDPNPAMIASTILLAAGAILSTIGAGMRFYNDTIDEGRAQVVLGKVECVILNESVLCEPKKDKQQGEIINE